MTDPRIRQLNIKAGVVKRLVQEKSCYEKEIIREIARLEKFKNDGEEEHKLKKQAEVIEECQMMLPDARRRLQKEFELLEQYLQNEKDLEETEPFTKANAILLEARRVLDQEAT